MSHNWSKSTEIYDEGGKLIIGSWKSSKSERDVGKLFVSGIGCVRFHGVWGRHRDDDGNLNCGRDFCGPVLRVITWMIVFKELPRKRIGKKSGKERGGTLVPALLRRRRPCGNSGQVPGCWFLWNIRNGEWLLGLGRGLRIFRDG